MSDPTTFRDKLAGILAAHDPRNPWNGDDPNPAPHHSIMIGAILDEMMNPSEGMLGTRGGYWRAQDTATWQAMLQHIRDGGK